MRWFFGGKPGAGCLRAALLLAMWMPLNLLAQVPRVGFSSRPEHAVLFIIDGLSYKAWDRLAIPTLRELARGGALVEKDYLPPPADPRTGPWAEMHSCSTPNPIMMSGTVFITKGTGYLQQSFPASEVTAFVANAAAYVTIASGYTYSYQREGPDSEAVQAALEIMRIAGPRFMRVHLQETGSAGYECMTTEKDVDWRFNIWAGDSPYRMAAERADSLLGQFLRGLDRLGALERTVIIILGDHGQDDGGWHPLQSADAAITTMVLWGAGVRSGAKIPYAEHIDVSPTICALMGVNTPKSSQGRVITGALSGFNGVAEPQAYRIRELNEGFSEYRKLVAEATCALQHLTSLRRGSLHYRLDRIRQNFYDMNRFTEWPRFRTVEELLANNRAELERLRELHRIVTGS